MRHLRVNCASLTDPVDGIKSSTMNPNQPVILTCRDLAPSIPTCWLAPNAIVVGKSSSGRTHRAGSIVSSVGMSHPSQLGLG